MKTTTAKPAPARPHRAQPGENRRSDSKEASFTTAPAAPVTRWGRGGWPIPPASGANAKAPALGPLARPSRPALKRQRRDALAAAAKRVATAWEVRQMVKVIQDRAKLEEWSGRETAKHTGITGVIYPGFLSLDVEVVGDKREKFSLDIKSLFWPHPLG